MNRNGGCARAILAFTAAALAVRFLEVAWPYLLATILLAVALAGARALTRTPQPAPLDAAKATGRWAQATRMTDAEREQVACALNGIGSDSLNVGKFSSSASCPCATGIKSSTAR